MCQCSQNDFYSDVKKGHMCSLEMNNHLRHGGVLIHADTDRWRGGVSEEDSFICDPVLSSSGSEGETSHLFFFHQQHRVCSSLLFKPDLVSSQQSNHTSGIILWRQVSGLKSELAPASSHSELLLLPESNSFQTENLQEHFCGTPLPTTMKKLRGFQFMLIWPRL